MRTIEKGDEPTSLRRHRNSGGTYASYTQTDDLRRALLRDQGHLCCYCMTRITSHAMKNEHWAVQSVNKDSTLDWDNLMGACSGGNGERRAIKHCDTSRGNKPLKVNPLDHTRRCERLIQYRANGEMYCDDAEILKDLQVTLNLNNEGLMPKRVQAYDLMIGRLRREHGEDKYWPRDVLERELEVWKRRDKAGMYREYCQVAIYFLEKWLRRKA